MHISTIEITWKKVGGTTWIFRPSKLHRERYVEATWIFQPAKLRRKMYVETTCIFQPSKLHRQRYVETTSIFRPLKLHRKSTRKWRGNSSKFGLRHIDVISTSNRRGFDMVCPLGCNTLRDNGNGIILLIYEFQPDLVLYLCENFDVTFLIYHVITWSKVMLHNSCIQFHPSHQIWFTCLFLNFDIII